MLTADAPPSRLTPARPHRAIAPELRPLPSGALAKPSSRRMLRSLLFQVSFPLAAVCGDLRAQRPDTATTTVVSGVVVDALRRPVEGAEISVTGAGLTALTSATGSFRLLVPQRDEFLVLIRRPGYKSQLISVRPPWSGTVQLATGVFELPEIQVTARFAKPAEYAGTTKYDDFFRRRRLGLGQFIDRSELDRRSPTRAVEILQGRAGIRVDLRPAGASGGTIVAFSRCNEFPPKINVYVDGRRLMPEGSVLRMVEGAPAPPRGRTSSGENDAVEAARREARAMVGTMLDRIAVGDIELIEIFRGPGELPPEFNEGNCGAISVWTRQAR